MSLYKGSQLISGAMPNSANQSLSNLDSAGQDKFDAKVDLDLTNVNNVGYIKMAGAGMPSSRYIDLTLGANGSTYTAPANGWFYLRKHSNDTNQFIGLYNHSEGGVSSMSMLPINNFDTAIYIPVKKGNTVDCFYSMGGATDEFRFIYAVGSESEAS